MSSRPAKEQSHQQLNHELRDVISILTGLGKTNNVGDDDAMGIITLAGTNKGAMMKMEGSEAAVDQISTATHHSGGEGTEAFANSNYQSINNSIVIGGSCGAEDPGVHLLIQDYVEGDGEGEGGEGDGVDDHHETKSKKKKKNKKQDEEKKEKMKEGRSEDEKQHVEAKKEESTDVEDD